MGLGVGSSAIPMQGAVATSGCAYNWLKSLACSGNIPLRAEWERIHSDDGLEAFSTQSKLGKRADFRIDDLHEDTVVVTRKVASPASVEDGSGSAVARDMRTAAGMGEAAMPMQASPTRSGQTLDRLVRLDWSVGQRWIGRHFGYAPTAFNANAGPWVLSVAEPDACRRRSTADSGGLVVASVATRRIWIVVVVSMLLLVLIDVRRDK